MARRHSLPPAFALHDITSTVHDMTWRATTAPRGRLALPAPRPRDSAAAAAGPLRAELERRGARRHQARRGRDRARLRGALPHLDADALLPRGAAARAARERLHAGQHGMEWNAMQCNAMECNVM